LLEKGFEPARTIVLASGFDEEISGLQVSNPTFYSRSDMLILVVVLDDRVPNISPMRCYKNMVKIRLRYL
jgi:hypothetical protein